MDADIAAKLKKIEEKLKRIHDTDTLQTIYDLFVIIFAELSKVRQSATASAPSEPSTS